MTRSTRRDRVAVRVARRMAELRGDQLLELLREDVLEHLGLVVDTVPRHVERLGEVQLEQPVVAQHLERDAHALGGQPHALVGHVRDEPELVELADHSRGRRRRDIETLGQSVGRHGPARALTELVDRLGVVLDGGGKHCLAGCHESNYGMPKIIFKPLPLYPHRRHGPLAQGRSTRCRGRDRGNRRRRRDPALGRQRRAGGGRAVSRQHAGGRPDLRRDTAERHASREGRSARRWSRSPTCSARSARSTRRRRCRRSCATTSGPARSATSCASAASSDATACVRPAPPHTPPSRT